MAKLSMQAFEFQLDRQYASKLGRKGGKALRGHKKAKRQPKKEKPFSPLP
jgi:general stress protein YciG